MKKIICIVLALSMLIPLSSCKAEEDAKKPSDTTKAPSETTSNPEIYYEPDSLPDDLDFGGMTVKFASLAGDKLTYEINFTVDELSSDVVNDSIYNRELYVEDRLGVEIENYKLINVTDEIDKNLNSGEDVYDAYIHSNHNISKFVFFDYFTDLNTVKYLDFDKPWWSQKFNEEAALFDELYLSTGSLCLSLVRNTFAVYYNKALAEDYEGSIPELANLYDLVNSGKWTFDKFVELGGGIYNDLNGDSTRDLEDLYGIAYGDHTQIDAIWSGFDLNIFSKTSDGWYELDVNTDKMYTALGKLHTLIHETTGSITANVVDSNGEEYKNSAPEVQFANGTNLFLVSEILYAQKESLRNMQDDYGLIPFPKYDENQKDYYSFSSDTYGAVAIPITNSDPDVVGAVIEAMASYSYRNTLPLYLDTVLKGQYMSDADSRRMVDIIVDGIMMDTAWIYLHTLACQYPEMYRYMVEEGDQSYAAKHASLEKNVKTVLKIYKRDLQQ